jgi:hypothetical protein
MDYVIARMVGNELPPRDSDKSRYRSLLHILQNEQVDGFNRLWVLNRIHDPDYRQLLIDTLMNEQVLEIPFKLEEYIFCNNFHEQILYAINVNGARNFALSQCLSRYDFTVLLDQDCYYQPDEWRKTRETIESTDSQYYFSPIKRWHLNMTPEVFQNMPEEEPMIIFRRDAEKSFNPNLRYGDRNKQELLGRIGIKLVSDKWTQTSDEAIRAGSGCHIAFSDYLSELDRDRRHRMRQKCMRTLIRKLGLSSLKLL